MSSDSQSSTRTSNTESNERIPADELRSSISRAVIAWIFGSAFVHITAGPVFAAFARSLGANDFLFGALAAALPATSFLQVFGARLLQRWGRPNGR
jgi:hypothetical protein